MIEKSFPKLVNVISSLNEDHIEQ